MTLRLGVLVGVAFALAPGACGHRSADEIRRGDGANVVAPSAAIFGQLVQSLPVCAEGQPSITVEEALARRWSPADCLLIAGELVLDSRPGVCGSVTMGASDVCPAGWALVGTSAKAAPAPGLPGVRRLEPDAHTLMLSNHRGFLSAVECRHDFLGYCEEDDGGRPRMPSGARFHLPAALREPSRPFGARDLPGVRVAILGAVFDPCAPRVRDNRGATGVGQCADDQKREVALTAPGHGFEMARICRVE